MKMLSTHLSKISSLLLAVMVLSACSTVDGFFGGGLNDPENLDGETEQNAEAEMTPDDMDAMAEEAPEMVVLASPMSAEEMMNQKDEALMVQAMRLSEAERALMALQEQNSALEFALDTAQMEAEEKQALLDEQN